MLLSWPFNADRAVAEAWQKQRDLSVLMCWQATPLHPAMAMLPLLQQKLGWCLVALYFIARHMSGSRRSHSSVQA